MFKTQYDVLTRNGKEKYVVVPLKEYQAMLERLEDDADYRALQKAKKRNAGKPTVPHEQVMRRFDLTSTKPKRKSA